jgi:hypothetical protein
LCPYAAPNTGGELGTPKNRERRDVDLVSDVVELLGWWRGEHAVSAHADTLVFPGEGKSVFLSPSTFSSASSIRQ